MKRNSVLKNRKHEQVRGPALGELMTDSGIKGDAFRKKNSGEDVLKDKIHHPESKQENPKR